MKKSFSTYSWIKHRQAKKRWEQDVERKGRKPTPRYTVVHPFLWGNKIKVPSCLSIYDPVNDSFKETVEFIDYIANDFEPLNDFLDFSETDEITAAAVTMLYSALEVALNESVEPVSFIRPGFERVNTGLRRANIYKLLSRSEIFYSLTKAESIPVVSSVCDDYTYEVCEHIKYRYFQEGLTEEEIAEKDFNLGNAINETVENVLVHAYPDESEDDKKWWLSCEVIKDTIFLAIYDAGVGIPNTVHERKWFSGALLESRPEIYKELDAIKDKMSLLSKLRNYIHDVDLIYISMLDDYSGTLDQKRGQGSKSIKRLVSDTDNGKLWVFSGKGLYKFINDIDKPELIRLPSSITGTLIQWNIKLP